ncbi:hypothetical protein KP509_31G041500 [Ceratopteris richardii]|uniref:Uncharacterized protein n=1 Tax=Ceratopteris richardii TaxID=49495 RepID=A0A8T2QZK4_CERRI|nr:hypothetical protein KP509_31G041500 [Ceratopteris richardii]
MKQEEMLCVELLKLSQLFSGRDISIFLWKAISFMSVWTKLQQSRRQILTMKTTRLGGILGICHYLWRIPICHHPVLNKETGR